MMMSSAHAVRFRADANGATVQSSKTTATTKPHGNNAVYVNLELNDGIHLTRSSFSGWMINSHTVLTVAHDLKTFPLEGAYVTNDSVVEVGGKNIHKYGIEAILFHPDYVEEAYSQKPFGVTLQTLSDPFFRIANAQHRLDADPSKEFKGVDLAILHLKDPVPNVMPLAFYDPSQLAQDKQVTLYSYGRMGLSNGKDIGDPLKRYRHVGVSTMNFLPEHNVLYSTKVSPGGVFDKFVYNKTDHQFLSHTHKGDSGCGVVITDPVDQKPKLLGVNSRFTGVQIPNMDVPNYEMSTPVYLYHDWIMDNLSR
jgi:hypothetical protein